MLNSNILHKMEKNSLYKPSTAKIIAGVMIMFMLISCVSALDWDNVKDYDEETKIITITNAFGLPEILGGEVLFKAQLLTPQHNVVGIGNQVVATIKIYSYSDIETRKDIGTYDIKKDYSDIDREIKTYYRVYDNYMVDDMDFVCGKETYKNGTIMCPLTKLGEREVERFSSVEFKDFNELPKGEVIIDLKTIVYAGDKVEWIPEGWYGEVIDEWASYEEGLNDYIENWFTMNDTRNDTVGGVAGSWSVTENYASGIIGNSAGYNAGLGIFNSLVTKDYDRDWSVSFWYEPDGAVTSVYLIPASTMDSGGTKGWLIECRTDSHNFVLKNGDNSATDDMIGNPAGDCEADGWHHMVLAWDDTANTFTWWFDGNNMPDLVTNRQINPTNDMNFLGSELAGRGMIGDIDEIAIFNTTINESMVQSLYNSGSGITHSPSILPTFAPLVTTTYPINTSTYTTFVTELNYTVSDADDDEDSCWYSLNDGASNTSIGNVGVNVTGLSANIGQNNWSVYCNDSENSIGQGTTQFYFSPINPDASITLPLNTTYTTAPNTLNYEVSGADDCFYSTDGGTTNSSVTCGENITGIITTQGQKTWLIKTTTALGGINNSYITFFLDSFAPIISIDQPENKTYITTDGLYNLSVNQSSLDIHLDSCWYNNETANVTFAGCATNSSVMVTEGSHTFNFYANDTFGNLQTAFSRTFFVNVYNNSYDYTDPAIEGETYTLSLNTTSTSISSYNGTLVYNGTDQTTSFSDDGTLGQLSSTITLPQVTTTILKNLYWRYYLNGIYYNTSVYTQLVQNIPAPTMGASCAVGLSPAMNFTFKNEINETTYTGDIKYILRYGISNNTQISTNGTVSAVPSFVICINSTLYNDYTIGYGELQYSRTGFADRRWYIFENERLTNATVDNILHFITGANSFLFTIQDAGLTPYVGKYLALNRWYPEIDEYKVVEMAKTDDEGQTVMKVEVEDTDYRVGVHHTNGTLIYLANPIRFVCIASPCTYSLTVPDEGGNDFENWNNLEIEFDYNTTTGTFKLTYNDPSQDTSEIRMEVFKETGTTQTSICSDTASSYTGVLTCNVSAYSGLLRAVAYRTASPEVSVFSKMVQVGQDAIDRDSGLFITLILMILLVSIGVFSPILTVILSVLALVPAIVLGIMPLSIALIFSAMSFIVISFMKRSVGR